MLLDPEAVPFTFNCSQPFLLPSAPPAELTLRDLEAVAKQAAEELTNQHSGSSGGGFWPFNGKNEERQLVREQPGCCVSSLVGA